MMIIEVALGILLAFFLLATIRIWLPLLLGLAGIGLILIVVLVVVILINA